MKRSLWFRKSVLGITAMSVLLPGMSSYGADTVNSTILSCVQSMCGPKYPMTHPFDTNPNLQFTSESIIQSTIKGPLTEYMTLIFNKAKTLDSYYKKIDFSKVSLSEDQKAFLVFNDYSNNLQFLSSAIKFDRTGMYFDLDKLKELLPNATDADIEAFSKVLKVVQISYALNIYADDSIDSFLKVLYPKMTFAQALKAAAEDIQAVDQLVIQIFPIKSLLNENELLMNKMLQGKTLNGAEQKQLRTLISRSFIYQIVLTDDFLGVFKKIPFDTKTLINERLAKYNASSNNSLFSKNKLQSNYLDSRIQYCTQKLSYALAAVPSQSEVDTFKKNLNTIKAVGRKILEEKTKRSLPNIFSGEVFIPPVRENILTTWSDALSFGISKSKSSMNTVKSLNLNDPNIKSGLMMLYLTSDNSDIFTDVTSFCADQEPQALIDHAQPSNGNVTLSWVTIRHPEYGIPIIAHELGHVADARLPGVFVKEQTCLAGMYGKDQYVSEDFADMFAAEIQNRTKGLINGTKTGNLGCALLTTVNKNDVPETLANKNESDVHSSNFFRLLSSAAMTKAMTPQCSKYLDMAQTNLFKNYCRWQK